MNNHSKKAHKAAMHAQKGHRYHQQGKLEKAKAEFNKILKIQGNHFDALQGLGAIYLQEKNYPAAIRHLTSACVINTEVPGLQCNLGLAYRYSNDSDKAAECFAHATRLDPSFAAAYYNLALCQIAGQDYPLALQTLNNAERCRPGHFGTLEQTAHVLENLNLFSQAISYYQHALQIEPRNIQLLFSYGKVLQSDRRYLKAIETFEKMLTLDAENYGGRAKLADLLESINQPSEAQQHAEWVLNKVPQHPLASLVMARLEYRKKDFIGAKQRLAALPTPFSNKSKDNEATDIDAAVQTQLGSVLDRLEEYQDAFSAFSQANQIMAQLPAATMFSQNSAFDVISAYDTYLSSSVENTPAQKIEDGLPSPTFLVGFPRSGTTLTEQILAANAGIVTGDELTTLHDITTNLAGILGRDIEYPQCLHTLSYADICTIRKHYWESTVAILGEDVLTSQFVDKMPLNIIHIALIEKLFPATKIIVALRDPRDICLSCFMQLFQLNDAMLQFLKMESSVDYYCAVMQLWLKYRGRTRLHWIESRYEDIVTDIKTSTQRLNDFLGAGGKISSDPFHQQASQRIISTPSYQDVGTPIYQRAKGRWKNYQPFIEEPIKKLTPLIQAFGYTP
jgi:tetratricopeptide (TPR) repeat protein